MESRSVPDRMASSQGVMIMIEVHECVKGEQVAKLEERVKVLEKEVSANENNIEKFNIKFETQYKLSEAIAVMVEQMKTMNINIVNISNDFNNLSNDVKDVKKKVDADKMQTIEEKYREARAQLGIWEKYKVTIITSIILAILGVVYTTIGL